MKSPGIDDVVDLMKRAGIPYTRENYIDVAYGNQRPTWTAELESELPDDLQQWDLFVTGKQGQLVFIG